MACYKNRLVIKIKSGEVRPVGFTIKSKKVVLGNVEYIPVDLTNYSVDFEVKLYPYNSVEPIIKKSITTIQDSSTGWIYEQTGEDIGRFFVQITEEDMNKLIPEKEYSVIVTLINGTNRIIISGEGDSSGILEVCKS